MRYLDIGTVKKISKIGLGTWQFGAREWGYGEPYAEIEAKAIVRRALELGVTLFDTAEIYSSGRSEEILGRALGKHRESAFVATKMFPVVPSAFVLKQRATASIRRIGVARLELYQVHYPNPLVSDRTLMRGMRSLQRAGLIADVGVSNYSLTRWRSAEDSLGSPILTNQVEYSLVKRSPERELLPFAESNDRAIIAFSPLAMGLLSGKYHGTAPPANLVRAANPRFGPEYLARTCELVAVLRDVADAHAASPAQIALAWAIRSPAVVAIPGAATVEQLESNVAAAEITLTDDEYRALRLASTRLSGDPSVARSGNGDSPEPGPSARLAMRHSLRCGWYVAKTVWRDHTASAARRGRQTTDLVQVNASA